MSRVVRVCHLITDSGVGGAEKALFELVTRLSGEEFELRVIAIKEPGETAARLSNAGVPVISLGLPRKIGFSYVLRLPAALFKLSGLLKKYRPDLLHCWLFQANLLGRMAARMAGVPVNLSSLRVIERERFLQYPLDRLTRGLVSRYVAVSEGVARHYRVALRLPEDMVVVIPNGVEEAEADHESGRAFRARLNIAGRGPVIGAAGRFHRQKGIDVLIRSLPDLARAYPGLVLLVAGDGPERGNLEAMASALAPDAVRFLGEWKKMDEFYSALDLFVLPSRWEGMPNVVLEAMVRGLPVVATSVASELVAAGKADEPVDGETGLLVETDSPSSLARAIEALLDDRERARRMGLAGRARALGDFSMDSMVKRYQNLYLDLLGEKP